MAGIKGAPAPKPSQLADPDPSAELENDLASDAAALVENFSMAGVDPSSFEVDVESIAAGQDEFLTEQEADLEAPDEFDSPLATQALPIAGGIAGGIAGARGGLKGVVAGATLGGLGGQGWRDVIETQLLGKKQSPPGEVAQEIATAGALEGAGAVVGLGIAKGVGTLAKVASKRLSQPVKEYLGSVVKKAKDAIEGPLTEFVAKRSTSLNTEGAGNTAKQLLKKNIEGKYGPFIKAYGDLDTITKATNLDDAAKLKFTVGLREWAGKNFAGDNLKVVNKFADDIDNVTTGGQLDDLMGQMSDMRNIAFKGGAAKQGKLLKEVGDRSVDFMESQINGLAERAAAGKASSGEMQFIVNLMKERGVQGVAPEKFAKTMASDYMKSRDALKSDYAGFKSFLGDVAEQVKLKLFDKGPKAFLNAMDDVPAEKLIERMFDPKNARALSNMQKETPEVFDIVVKSKMAELLRKSSPTGNLDIKAFQKLVTRLPDSTRKFLFDKEGLKLLNKIANDPRLKRLDNLDKFGQGVITKTIDDIFTISGIAIQELGAKGAVPAAVRQTIGRPVAGAIADRALPKKKQARPPLK